MSVKECTHHKGRRKRLLKRLCAGLLIFNFILLVIILLVWAVLQPKKPRFILQDATIFNFNLSAPPIVLTSSMQVTIYSRNPNDKLGIFYNNLAVYATYNNQQITFFTAIPDVYQGHKDVNVWSPFLLGNNVPIAPFNGISLGEDKANGAVQLVIKIDGRIKWKVGTFTSSRYHMHVTCNAYIPFGNRATGIVVGTGIKYQLSTSCHVSF